MADSAKQYDWSETKGFHPELIRSLVTGAIVTPLVLAIPVAGIVVQLTGSLSIPIVVAILVLAVPLGAGLGYLVGLGRSKQRLRWVRWAAENGWTYEAEPSHPGAGILDHPDQLSSASLYWRHATRRDLIGRRTTVGGACVLTAKSVGKADAHQQYQTGKQEQRTHTGMCVYLVMDTGSTCPDMTLHPHAFSDRLPIPRGHATVQFEVDAFNQAWTVRAADEKAAFARIDQKTIDFLMKHQGHFLLEFVGGLLVVQYWISEAEEMHFVTAPRPVYERLIAFTRDLTKAVPDDLVPPLELDSGS
ncbi:MAG: hypothetical protein VX726_00985 [Planctomycetota bacterium]|nr:hypothetical protein [Planctomycetota bacterium]